MFQRSGKLEHLLAPSAYFSPEWWRDEQERIFRHSRQYFCRADQVAQHGDRFAREIGSTPIVVINLEGELYALQNICAHRHSRIVPDGQTQGEKLRCQIHGWEYDRAGQLAHLPDGRSFVGVKAKDFCLRRFRVERAGPFVFVNQSTEGPSFEEHLGSFAPEFKRFYSNVRHIATLSSDHPVNWKIVAENAVESYHVPLVHTHTYEDYRPEELHDHRLEPTYTRYGDLLKYGAEKSLEARGFEIYTRVLIRNPTFERFTHVHIFPNLLLYFGDVFRNLTVVEPLGPEKSRVTMHGFVPTDIRGGVFGRALQDLSMKVFLAMARKIIREDQSHWPPVQQGLRQSTHRGVLGAREERVYAFQEYVSRALAPHPEPRDEARVDAVPAGGVEA